MGSGASRLVVGGLPSLGLWGYIPGRWSLSSSHRARYSSRSRRSCCSSSVHARKSGHRRPGWVRYSSRFWLAWTLAMSSPSVGCQKWNGAPLLIARKYAISSRLPWCCQLVLASTSALRSSHASTRSGPRMSRSICSSSFHS